jgi:hypothetical protein
MNWRRMADLFIGSIQQQRGERSARTNSPTETNFEPACGGASDKPLILLGF